MHSDNHRKPTALHRKVLSLAGVRKKNEVLFKMLTSLIQALEERDRHTRGHSERVATLAVRMGRRLGFPQADLEDLRHGALLHDIGKVGISDELLFKPWNFTPDERARMNRHPEKGYIIALQSPVLRSLIPMIRSHHERYDGKGYPDRLKGEEIPLSARIVSLADMYDALVSVRPYKKAFPKKRAVQMIRRLSGTKFDPKVVDAFLHVVHRKT
jgi:putative nucleotidyltransferase with HDIG domain